MDVNVYYKGGENRLVVRGKNLLGTGLITF